MYPLQKDRVSFPTVGMLSDIPVDTRGSGVEGETRVEDDERETSVRGSV